MTREKLKSGASVAGTAGLGFRVLAYFQSHVRSFLSSLGRLSAAPFSTIIALMVIGVALSLPVIFYVLVDNIRLVSGRFVDSNQITLFLKPVITDESARRLAEGLAELPEVEAARLITKDQALAEFKQYSGFSAAIEILDSNPFPAVILINPEATASPDRLEEFTRRIEAIPEADFARFDLQWVKRLKAIVAVAESGVEIIGLLLGIGVVFVVSNTIRLELRTREYEIVVQKLLGATDAFIRRPFLYSGFWYGFGGGMLAVMLVSSILYFFEEPIHELSLLYASDYQLAYLGLARVLLLLVASSLLGIAGAWMVLFDQLHKMNPD
ncbi:MAG: permease-like cell division protein FtsX [Methylococcales bacterium]